jgi:hypothetical protein
MEEKTMNWKIMADPEHKGKHSLHDNRFITTGDCEFDKRGICSSGSIICSLRDQPDQRADAVLLASAPEMRDCMIELSKALDSVMSELVKTGVTDWGLVNNALMKKAELLRRK